MRSFRCGCIVWNVKSKWRLHWHFEDSKVNTIYFDFFPCILCSHNSEIFHVFQFRMCVCTLFGGILGPHKRFLWVRSMDSRTAGYPWCRLFTPNPGVFADEKKTSGSASIDASRLIFQSAVSFSNPHGSLSNPIISFWHHLTLYVNVNHMYQHQS